MQKIISLPWQVPFGTFALKLDPLSLVFLFAIVILVVCSGLYGIGYLRPYKGKKGMGWHLFFYILLAVSLILVVTANNVILFLGAWELMAIANYFLIIFNNDQHEVRRAGFLYLMATHCGTFCLFLMFFLMANNAAGSMNFDVIAATNFSPIMAGIIFVLALLGFGVKAGFCPMHIWLPHAHPAAPSHVSALMSGLAIKTGIYGICRVIWIMKILPDWCGYVLLIIGASSGLLGVLYALGQHELKKLLAYHSIENIGIIALGLGVGLLGRTYNQPFLSAVGFAGALLHVINHALFKGLLFLGAGSVIQKTHTGNMDHLGGLAKVMPYTSALFLVGALSICGLPLFNGFISEFIIFMGLFNGLFNLPQQGIFFCGLGIVSLAVMGALALACFTKVYGTVFLGEVRAENVNIEDIRGRKESTSKWMIVAMMSLAGLCLWIGLAPHTMVNFTLVSGQYLSGKSFAVNEAEKLLIPLATIISVVLFLIVVFLGLIVLRRLVKGNAAPLIRETWSCGFEQFSPRFQYTSASFARSIVEFAKNILLFNRQGNKIMGAFPAAGNMSSAVKDAAEEIMVRPFYIRLIRLSRKIDENRNKYTQMYLMYIFLFLIFLLVWKIR
ncbi:MAG: hydrogenase [Candidatus Omnitrophica bacterium]|nr:hydrogenase [Candidatus Omnitrophota bacterium]